MTITLSVRRAATDPAIEPMAYVNIWFGSALARRAELGAPFLQHSGMNRSSGIFGVNAWSVLLLASDS